VIVAPELGWKWKEAKFVEDGLAMAYKRGADATK